MTPSVRVVHGFDVIKRLMILSACLIAVLTLALVPLMRNQFRAAAIQQAEAYTISELHHFTAMQWQSFVVPVLIRGEQDPKYQTQFQAFIAGSTQSQTIKTLTLYDRNGKRLFAPRLGGSQLTPEQARAAMAAVHSEYEDNGDTPFLHTGLPIAADGSIIGRAPALPQAQPQHPMEMGTATEYGTMTPAAPDPPLDSQTRIGLITLDQDMTVTAGALRQFQQVMGGLLIGLMALLLLALLWAIHHTGRIITSQYDQLATQHVALQRLEKTKEELSNMLLHDLRNPVTAMISSLDLLKIPEIGTLTTDQHEIVTQAQASGRRMRSMLNDLLTISKLEEGELLLVRKPFEPGASLAKLISELQPWAEQSDHHLQIVIAEHTPAASLDESLIQRVLSNLISNAVQHTPAGSSIIVRAGPMRNGLELRVEDDGPGIPADQHEHIFERWGQVKGSGSGHGLGLTFCKLAVEAHGGTITVASEPGQGATFIIWLPVEPTVAPVARPMPTVEAVAV